MNPIQINIDALSILIIIFGAFAAKGIYYYAMQWVDFTFWKKGNQVSQEKGYPLNDV
jgi:hypothetical protein